jgi:hypothetical protein
MNSASAFSVLAHELLVDRITSSRRPMLWIHNHCQCRPKKNGHLFYLWSITYPYCYIIDWIRAQIRNQYSCLRQSNIERQALYCRFRWNIEFGYLHLNVNASYCQLMFEIVYIIVHNGNLDVKEFLHKLKNVICKKRELLKQWNYQSCLGNKFDLVVCKLF